MVSPCAARFSVWGSAGDKQNPCSPKVRSYIREPGHDAGRQRSGGNDTKRELSKGRGMF